MKLKTLKDLQTHHATRFPTGIYSLIEKEELRQLAIEWIKQGDEYINLSKNETLWASDVIAWIKHFFNLTDEDLK